ncbi:MAG: SAM-dependent methyltransferase [Turneriella sp.]|nr:SAM-dependent methyltransferase [Turneriella sp.]
MRENTPSRTAEVVALMRALDYAYYGEKSIIRDRYAVRFLSEFYMAIYNRLALLPDFMAFFINSASFGLFDFVILRHALMDYYTRKLGRQMPVVLLGAGYDTRGLRLEEYICHGLWEFDFPATQRRKKFYLRDEQFHKSPPHYCEVDFMKEPIAEAFSRAGVPRQPALVLWEGVSVYVSEDVVRNTLNACREHFGPGTVVVFDYWHKTNGDLFKSLLNSIMPAVMEAIYNERFIFGAPPQQMRKMAMECGARNFESLTGTKIMKKLLLTSRLPLTSASVAVVEF